MVRDGGREPVDLKSFVPTPIDEDPPGWACAYVLNSALGNGTDAEQLMPVPVEALKSLGYEARLRFVVGKNDPTDGQMTAEYGYEQLEENF